MISKLKLWDALPSLLSVNQRQHTSRHTMPESSVFSGMALDIAVSNKLSEAMSDALGLIQTQIRHTLNADVLLLLPESLNPESSDNQLKLYHSPAISPATEWIDQLLNDPSAPFHYRDNAPLATNAALTQALEESFDKTLSQRYADVHIETIRIKATGQTAWLLLSFSGNKPGQALIQQHTGPFKNELSRGISAWQTQQKAIESAITEERKVHAAELHDSMAQVLAYMRLRTAKLSSMCDEAVHQELKPIAEDLSVQAHGAYRHARELITTSRLSMECCSLKQALSNIVRHSRASHARVVLFNDREQNLIIRVEDNGKGISHKQARSDSFGLKIMQERAQRLNAELAISPRTNHDNNSADQGTTITLTIPKREAP